MIFRLGSDHSDAIRPFGREVVHSSIRHRLDKNALENAMQMFMWSDDAAGMRYAGSLDAHQALGESVYRSG